MIIQLMNTNLEEFILEIYRGKGMKYHCVKQHDKVDCGAACIATVARQYGLRVSLTKMREAAGTDAGGTNLLGMIKAAESIGLTAKGAKGSKESFFSKFPLPCVAHVITKEGLRHYIVIHKISKKKLVIADPAHGIIKISTSKFLGDNLSPLEHPKYLWTGILLVITPSEKFKKGKEKENGLEHFWHLLKPHKGLLIEAFIASIIFVLLGILGAFYFQLIIDYLLPAELKKTLTVISIGVILLNIFRVFLNAFRTHVLLYLSQKIDIMVVLGYYKHLVGLPMSFFATRKIGEIISRFQDAGKVRNAISGTTLSIMIDTVMVVVGGIILFNQNSQMFLVTLVMIILYIIIVLLFGKKYSDLNRDEMDNYSHLTSYLVESLNGIQTIKAYNAEEKAKIETETRFVKLLRSIFDLSFVENIQSSIKLLIELVGEIIILWIGGINVIEGNITIGQLVVYNSLLIYFLDPLKRLIDLQPQIQTAIVAADRLNEILNLEIEKDKSEKHKLKLDSLYGDIEFKNVNFRYGTRERVLHNISLKIKKGQKVAIIGESGSGKTTLAKLLLHLYKVEDGMISIAEDNIEDIKIDILREKIAYVSQETFLYSGTILENIMLGASDEVSLKEVIEISKKTQAHEFINELPMRYETILEENGSNLSGGQRQRLALTRAMLKKPDILILDEATSNLDPLAERKIYEAIQNLAKNMTVIIITHRLNTVKGCDYIFVIDKGKVIEKGTHSELRASESKYAELVRQQSLDNKGI